MSWAIFWGEDIGYFCAEFTEDSVYKEGDESRYANDSGYKLCHISKDEENALIKMLDLDTKERQI